MKTVKLTPKLIRLDAKEGYTRLFSIKNGDALSFRSGHVVLKENESIGEHDTGDSEEILIILEGKGRLYIKSPLPVGERDRVRGVQEYGCEKLDFEKDTALYIPPNTVHDVKNVGSGILKYIFITSEIPSPRREEG